MMWAYWRSRNWPQCEIHVLQHKAIKDQAITMNKLYLMIE